MKIFTKYKWYWLAGLGIVFLYFFTRIYHLLTLPIFTDEAIYIRWSQIAANDANWRFISLTDGKQPMYVWIAMLFIKILHDPLLAGRLVSVLSGFISMIGMFFLGREVFKNTKIGLLTSFVYVLFPFALVYDKLAVYDSLVAMFMIWALYCTILLVRYVRLDLGMILGMVIGGGMITKSSADFGYILLPFSLLLFPFKKNYDKKRMLHFIIFALVSVIIANAIYAILRLSPFYYIIGQKNLTFIYSFNDWIFQPFAFFIGNMKGLGGWFIDYMTAPFLVLAAASFFVDKKFFREKLLLFIWFIFPFMALAFFGKVIYPRFILFMTMPIIVLGTYTLFSLMQKIKQFGLQLLFFIVFLSMFLVNDYYLLTDFAKASIPQSDKEQLINGWPAGEGVTQTVSFLQKQAQQGKVYVGTEGTFGLMPYALEMYLDKNPHIAIQGFWPINSTPPKEILDASKKMATYVVFYQDCPSCQAIGKAPSTWPVTPVFQLTKFDQNTYYTLYKVNPQ
ncbi:MAG TPA: glycosyltransferase family 39 protein [Candidatus Sulfotelmatobacter sp.]|jgi:4-amino-4-deoxy-L-arabinose transferase-like glycosyltransferase|nr:glycosyltransferase family 39 protein [Candidatus Sulfotelmatobacter sp.]